MAALTLPGVLVTGDHASRPAASAVAIGGLYACSTHGLIYQTDGSTWSTWLDPAPAGSGAYQPLDSDLTAFAGLAIAADKLPYGTGSHTLGLADFTSAGRALVDDADAAAQRTTLGLGTMATEAKTITTQDDLLVGGSAGALARLAKGSDGQVLTVDPTTHHLVWASPSAGFSNPMTTKGDVIVGDTGGSAIRKAVGSDGQVLTADAASTGGVKWAAAAGGGGSLYPLDSYALDGTYGDHFDGSGLDAAWTARTYTSAEEEYQVGKSGTYLRVKCAGRSAGQGYLRAAPSGDWTFAMKWIMRFPYFNPMNWGLGVVDSSGTGLCLFYYYGGPTAPILGQVSTYSSYGGSFVQPGGAGAAPNITLTNAMIFAERPIWYRLRKSGTSYYASWSMDGEVWCPESSAITWSGTVDRVGMFHGPLGSVSSGNGTGSFAEVDWFNKIA